MTCMWFIESLCVHLLLRHIGTYTQSDAALSIARLPVQSARKILKNSKLIWSR